MVEGVQQGPVLVGTFFSECWVTTPCASGITCCVVGCSCRKCCVGGALAWVSPVHVWLHTARLLLGRYLFWVDRG